MALYVRILIVAFLGVLWTSVARAEPTGEERALATDLFKRGRKLMAKGDNAAACPKLAESQRLDPGGGTLLNLAICHEKEGRTATAWTELHDALGQARRDGRRDRITLAQEHIDALEPRLCRLRIALAAVASLPGAEVRRNGARIARAAWGLAMPVDPGSHRIEVTAPGYRGWRHQAEVSKEGATVEVSVPMLEHVPASPAPPPVSSVPEPEPIPTPTPPPDGGWLTGRVVGFVLGGLGVAAVGVGIGAGLVSLDDKAASDDACTPRCGPHPATSRYVNSTRPVGAPKRTSLPPIPPEGSELDAASGACD